MDKQTPDNMGKTVVNSTDKVFVCGGGHQGLSMAAHLALNGLCVTMWNRTEDHIRDILRTRNIFCSGVINGTAIIERASSNMADVVSDFVMVTTPSTAHKDVARALAPYVHKNMIVILNPGRTFGALEFVETLRMCGVKEFPHIAETQTIVYTCRRNNNNSATIFALKNNVKIAALNGSDIDYIMSKMPNCLKPYFCVENSVALTSLENVGMILHCAPVMMNIGWIETSTVDFKYYYDGISHSIANFLEKIDTERLMIAERLGYEIESTADWLRHTYNVSGETLYECIHANESYREIDAPTTIECRYVMEDIPNGLVPLENIAVQLGVSVPNMSTIITLASSVMNLDFREIGRKFSLELLKEYFGQQHTLVDVG